MQKTLSDVQNYTKQKLSNLATIPKNLLFMVPTPFPPKKLGRGEVSHKIKRTYLIWSEERTSKQDVEEENNERGAGGDRAAVAGPPSSE